MVALGDALHSDTLRGNFDEPLKRAQELLAAGQTNWSELIRLEADLAFGRAIEFRLPPEPGPGDFRLALFQTRASVIGLLGSPELPALPEHPVATPLCRAWRALAEGDASPDLLPMLTSAADNARRDALADLVVECHAVRALLEAALGDLPSALRNARLASRMARTESIPSAEYLAGITLARLRRSTGYPHLAERILRALLRFAPAHWHPWVSWELALTGNTSVQSAACTAMRAAREGAKAGNADVVDRELTKSVAALSHFSLLSADAEAIRALLLPARAGRTPLNAVPANTVPLFSGPVNALPFSAVVGDGFVVCKPDGPGTPVHATGLPLYDVQQVQSDGLKHKRSSTLASVLSLAGGSMLEDECFEETYGFAYVSDMHRGTFDVLLHRTRGWLSDVALFERQGDTVSMTTLTPFVIRDPRASEPVEARVLRVIAAGGSTARAAAAATGLSVRQAQTILKALTEEGSCIAERSGPKLHYRVEDTTFSEPTRTRL